MNRTDRLVLAVGLILVLGTFLVPRVLFWLDPDADNRARYRFDVLEGDPFGPTKPIWCDANGIALPAEQPIPSAIFLGAANAEDSALVPPPFLRRPAPAHARQHEVVYQSLPEVPRDRWGNRWQLVVTLVQLDTGRLVEDHSVVYSCGPNGRFDWGQGDDIRVDTGGTWSRIWTPLAVLGGLIAFPYASLRVARKARARTLPGEVLLTSLVALAPIAIAYVVIVIGFPHLDQLPIGWGIVPPGYAVFFTAALIIWFAIFRIRVRRSAPPDV